MMNRKQWLLISILGVVLALAMIAPAMAQDSTATPAPQPTTPPLTASTSLFATANFRVNVRSGPGTQYTVLGQVHPGDALDITGHSPNNQWLRVNFNGQDGWVSAALVDVTGDASTSPEATAGPNAVLRQTSAQSNASQSGNVTVATRVNANLRTLPSVSADVIATIPFGTQLTVTGRTLDNNWVRVSYNDQTGWVSSGLLTFQRGNIVNVQAYDENGNQVTASPSNEPAGGTAPQPETTPNP